MEEIVIKPQILFKDYFKVSLGLVLNRPIYWILVSSFVLMLLVVLLDPQSTFSDIGPILLWLLLFPAMMVYAVYQHVKKTIFDQPRIKEDIRFIITNDYFQEKGESFEIKYFWKDLKKITETNAYFLLFIASRKALVIRKADLDPTQYKEIRRLLGTLPIKTKLK
ncbi:YcxB family protein [Flavobacterium sp.]|uniref:YcxB family protein n=1 Tax=Flavobacterium sp. TaxID=239 RepID=UPI0039E27337